MKQLYMVGGTMGIGKTAACQAMKTSLPKAVLLDGDWCWDMHPFVVTDETKQMVLRNICFLLNSFIHCSAYETIIFCWVMHEQAIIDEVLAHIDTSEIRLHNISLVASPAALRERLQRDIAAGVRPAGQMEESLSRLPLYEKLATQKVDTSGLNAQEVAQYIIERA